ncbi:hypothetical protein [Nocardia sp. NPDC127526]|uniref:hypothetical protein n=1 Tax=Nocardia sp. NPDC127526 TaxID=3345393 RepID=UPI00363FD6B8
MNGQRSHGSLDRLTDIGDGDVPEHDVLGEPVGQGLQAARRRQHLDVGTEFAARHCDLW